MSHSFNVEVVEEHDDGSATFTVDGDKASMQALFEAFFTQAVINGIDYAVEKKDRWIAERRLIEAALEMHKGLWAWRNIETVDWVDIEKIEQRFNTAIEEYKK